MTNNTFKTLRIFGIILFIAGISVFALYESRNLIEGPRLEVHSPSNGGTVESSLVEVRGQAANISEIKLNGKNIYIDKEGRFNEKLLLSYGYNVVKIEAEDRFGRKEEKTLQLVYK